MIRAVTFDFWETLVHDTPDNLRAQSEMRVDGIADVLERAGRGLPRDELAAGYERSASVLAKRYWSRHRDPSYREQVQVVLECIAPGIAAALPPALFEQAVEAYISPVLFHPPGLTPAAAEAVSRLARQGRILGIISNTGRTPGIVLRRVLEAYGLLDRFSVISYSDEVGTRKPDPAIFHRTLERAGVSPAEAVHVGDNAVDDVMGARDAGMRGVHYAVSGPGAPLADLVVSDLGELPDRLDAMEGRKPA
jgi:putative hydrolase of the HAD superfamily